MAMNGRNLLKLALITAILLTAGQAPAAVRPFPIGFQNREMKTPDGETLHVRVGGSGPAVLLLHGFGDTGDMWEPLARRLMRDHTVVVPDLRGMGLSSHPEDGYDKKSQAAGMAALLDSLNVGKFQLVTHDIGNMVGYALAAQYRDRVTAWVVMDAPLPGLGHWEQQLLSPKTWHFNFRGPDVERLVAGRERILLDRFYNELSAHPEKIDEQTREHYATLYARPKAMHDAFAQFAAFPTDAKDNQGFAAAGKLTAPVLAIGGAASYGASLAGEIGAAADHVEGATVNEAGHWLMEEQPAQTMQLITTFLASHP
jgi:pimeloyl-ACP methyl ester carboxylesterase